jgi:hypothetical protein
MIIVIAWQAEGSADEEQRGGNLEIDDAGAPSSVPSGEDLSEDEYWQELDADLEAHDYAEAFSLAEMDTDGDQ